MLTAPGTYAEWYLARAQESKSGSGASVVLYSTKTLVLFLYCWDVGCMKVSEHQVVLAVFNCMQTL
jgi:hypothetical protein